MKKHEITIWEYTFCVIALIVLLFVMALISADQMRMRDGLKIVYFSTLPFMLLRTYRAKGIYYLYCALYLLLLIVMLR